MELDLTAVEARVLFSLVEKETTTPDQYPLSTNSLRLACNQKSSRDPVVDFSEREVDAALLTLRERGLVRSSKPSGSRAWKHRHVISEVLPLDGAAMAVLAVLALRGAQSPGELRTRTERLHPFEDNDTVDATLRSLAGRDQPLVSNLGRHAGQSQDRWKHLLGAEAVSAEASRQRSMAAAFHELHQTGFFMLANPWDRGSARMLQELGAIALATTSSGFGRAVGKDDQETTRDELVAHVTDLAAFVDVPLSVDGERLFPEATGGITETVRLLAEAGAAGISIEDYDPTSDSIVSLDQAVEAVEEATAAAEAFGLVVTARSENFLYGKANLDDTIARLQAYEAAGAHCLYAPGVESSIDIELVVTETSRPINVLLTDATPTLQALADLGVRRASTGGALHGAAMRAARARARSLFE